MTRREDATILGTQQMTGDWQQKPEPPQFGQNPVVTWFSEFEERIASDFQRRTGLEYKKAIARIIEAAEPFPGMQVLDVPTGTGVIARQFVGKVGEKGRIIGIDETPEKLEQARLAAQSARVSMRIELKAMPIEKLIFEDGCIDLITSVMAFHRVDAGKFLIEACRVLRPGGRLLIADELAPDVPKGALRETMRRSWFRFVKRDQQEADAQFHTTAEMMRMLQEAGFNQIIFRTLRQRSRNERSFALIKAVK
ncbi:MAG: class I SAM-dependent methyltransferase [Blastocatellia bacterium]